MTEMEEDFNLVLDAVVDEALKSVLNCPYLLMRQIYQSTDPLDAPSFDPVAYINEQVWIYVSHTVFMSQFPDEEAMSRLNGYSKELEEQIQTLEDQILQTVSSA